MASEWIAAGAGFALVRRNHRLDRGRGLQQRRIRVSGGYEPAEVHVRAGRPVQLIFRREETALCSERVVFPDYGISVTLPPFQEISVELPACEPGEHEFTCEMQMLHGQLIVDPAEGTTYGHQHLDRADRLAAHTQERRIP
jgi:plastocyanin domain-containing protein